jgi:hypothetical protein
MLRRACGSWSARARHARKDGGLICTGCALSEPPCESSAMHRSPSPSKGPPSFINDSCAMANLMGGGREALSIARPCHANETATMIFKIRSCLTALRLSRPTVPARHEVGKDQGSSLKLCGSQTFVGRTGQDCNGHGCRLGTFTTKQPPSSPTLGACRSRKRDHLAYQQRVCSALWHS